jgi:hypothetical protein
VRIKLRGIIKSPKSFGFSDEKHLRGNGKYGYARNYGSSKHGNRFDGRNRFELRDCADRKLALEQLSGEVCTG